MVCHSREEEEEKLGRVPMKHTRAGWGLQGRRRVGWSCNTKRAWSGLKPGMRQKVAMISSDLWFMAQWGVGVGVIGLCRKVCLAKNAMVGVAVFECSWLKTQGWWWWWWFWWEWGWLEFAKCSQSAVPFD